MSRFYSESFTALELSEEKKLLKISDCLPLIVDTKFESELLQVFDVENMKDEKIPIKGLSKIVPAIQELN